MILKKIWDNVGINALKALGGRQYLIMVFQFARSIPAILKEKNLVALDKSMSSFQLKLIFDKYKLIVDIPYIDKNIREGSFAYGGIREIFIRKCYFKFHKIDFSKIKTVVDLGGNRGLFSTLCATFASTIVTVEPNPDYNDVIITNLANVNKNLNSILINKFVGGSGMHSKNASNNVTLNQIMIENSIEFIDFLKIDIEGSEFGLFNEKFPFDRIHYLSMEIHRGYGDPEDILNLLKNNNFQTFSCTSNFKKTSSKSEIDYIYAQNTSLC